ncbi:hypothetical protein VTK56DRAFT_3246 [Thermocarpiscus australiensis]
MTRTVVYSVCLAALLTTTAMTIASIVNPKWISYSVTTPSGRTVHDDLGLHRRCTSSSEKCNPFPDESRCQGDDGRAFCSMWRTAGFLMSLATTAELATIIGFLVIMAGGKAKRQGGWRVLGAMLVAVAVAQFLGMAVVAYLFDNDDLFLVPGYRLDSSWYLCTFSAGIALLTAFGLAISAFILPPEDGYVLLRDPSGV